MVNILFWDDFAVSLCDMLFANTHKFIHEARRLPPVIYDLQITYHKDQIRRKMISFGYKYLSKQFCSVLCVSAQYCMANCSEGYLLSNTHEFIVKFESKYSLNGSCHLANPT